MTPAQETLAGAQVLRSDRLCAVCGGPLTGQQTRACSPACRKFLHSKAHRPRFLADGSRECLICEAVYRVPPSSIAATCSHDCRRALMTRTHRERGTSPGRPRGERDAVRRCSAAPAGRPCLNPVTREDPICPEHMPRFSTWREPRPRYADALAWSGYSAQGAAISLGET